MYEIPLGMIDCSSLALSLSAEREVGRPFTFSVEPERRSGEKDRIYFLQASSSEEVTLWVRSIQSWSGLSLSLHPT